MNGGGDISGRDVHWMWRLWARMFLVWVELSSYNFLKINLNKKMKYVFTSETQKDNLITII